MKIKIKEFETITLMVMVVSLVLFIRSTVYGLLNWVSFITLFVLLLCFAALGWAEGIKFAIESDKKHTDAKRARVKHDA
jgi:hypothetical protein